MWIDYRPAPGQRELRPWVRIYVASAHIPLFALVDSGSDDSSFPLKLGLSLGLTYNGDLPPMTGMAAGGPFDYWPSANDLPVQTDVGSFIFRRPLLTRGGVDHPILGRSDFFTEYMVKFYERKSGMEIETYEEPRYRH